MHATVRSLMTANPIVLDASATPEEAACAMRDSNVGDVLVRQGNKLLGIVTDRDLVVRYLADDNESKQSCLETLCTTEVATLRPEDAVEDAIRLMEEHAIRRVPVVEDGEPVGIVSLGDLARSRDPESALGQISRAEPNN